MKRALENVISFLDTENISDFINVISLTNVINAPQQNNTASIFNKYTLKTGMYVLRCSGYKIALLNKGKTDSIIYKGDISNIQKGKDGNTYPYYEDEIIISVFSNFGYITVDVLGTSFKGNNILSYAI